MNEEEPKLPTVDELLFSAAASLVQLGAKSFVEEQVEDGQKAIEGIRALEPLLSEDERNALKEPLAQLQMMYVKATQKPDPGEEERAKARAKIWTPGS
ncbi:MAG: hypothetical protein H0T15_08305 [Thermoleophilaceae bacterium]|nr:hypothetical protein [Thermoleophilaceae bacterium]